MSVDSAWRRFGVASNGVARRDREWISPPALAYCASIGRCAEMIFIIAVLIFGGVELVKVLDAALDLLYQTR